MQMDGDESGNIEDRRGEGGFGGGFGGGGFGRGGFDWRCRFMKATSGVAQPKVGK